TPTLVPFLTFSFGLRSLADTNVKTKGYFSHKQVIPLNFSPENIADTDISHSVFDWMVKPVSSNADPNLFSDLPGFSSLEDTSSYFGTSERVDLGVNRWAISELPTQPLLSLCELQHFDPAFLNYHYPLMANAIGNSHASPFIAPGEVFVDGTNGMDHSYIANHLLWDDWFVSSLGPDMDNFEVTRSLDAVFEDALTGEGKLRNHAYRARTFYTEEKARDLVSDYKGRADSWRDVASEFVVEGMFNINSTSVAAWSALLRSQLRNDAVFQEIDPAEDATIPMLAGLGDQTASVSRFTLNSDENSSMGGVHDILTAPQEWTASMFDELAERIVEQVRLRGPFLSLSEFMNRQLSSDEDLALAGVVEKALLEFAEEGSNNPYSDILNEYSGSDFQAEIHDTYVFPEAGQGHAYYGTPGWARQADILRPIAPVLSARDDTFTIRTYGDSRDTEGNIVARAWCEAVVVRSAEFVDPTNDVTDEVSELNSVNLQFGRRFQVVSFRWLKASEV
ncbi:MAG: hypothetical protein ACQKBU_01860, partial [Verrucomicrobiales bacterium]